MPPAILALLLMVDAGTAYSFEERSIPSLKDVDVVNNLSVPQIEQLRELGELIIVQALQDQLEAAAAFRRSAEPRRVFAGSAGGCFFFLLEVPPTFADGRELGKTSTTVFLEIKLLHP